MKQIFVKSSYVQWNCQDLEVEVSAYTWTSRSGITAISDQIALRYAKLGVVKNAEHHLSLAALLPKPCIHRIFGELASWNCRSRSRRRTEAPRNFCYRKRRNKDKL